MNQVMYDAIQDFDLHAEARGLSGLTRRWYRDQVRLFGEFIEQHQVEPDRIDERIFLQFLVHERRRGLADKTIADRHLALGVFFRWCEQRNYFNGLRSPVTAANRPKVVQKEPRWVTLAQYEQLHASIAADSWLDHRDRLLLALMFSCGLRIGEVAGLGIGNVDLMRRRLKLKASSSKSRRDRYAPFSESVQVLAQTYLTHRPDEYPLALFLSDDGYGGVRGIMTKHAITPMLKRRCAHARMDYMNPHSFRHGFAMTMLNQGGAELSSVSTLLGHASVTTTEAAYARWLIDPLQEAYDEAQQRLRAKKTR